MRSIGVVIASIGAWLLTNAMKMDPSVPFELGGRINNVGLMNDKQNKVILGGVVVLAGVILIGSGSWQSDAASREPVKYYQAAPAEPVKKCPDCTEDVRVEAKVCRFCGLRFSDLESAVPDGPSEQPPVADEPLPSQTDSDSAPCESDASPGLTKCKTCGKPLDHITGHELNGSYYCSRDYVRAL